MRRSLVGRRGLVVAGAGLSQLRLGTGKAVGQLGQLTGKLEDDAVLLFHVSLEKGQAFFEVAEAGIHATDDAGGAAEGKMMPVAYD